MSENTAFEVGRLYLQLKRIADTLTAAQKDVFVRLPALVGYWPMSGRSTAGIVADHGTNFYPLNYTGTVPSGYDGNPFVHLGDGTNYLKSTTAGEVAGTETWVEAAIRGLTVGGWFMVDETPSAGWGFVSKDGAAANRGNALHVNPALDVDFLLSGNGGSLIIANGSAISLGSWNFLVGRFIPSTEVSVHINGAKSVNTTAVPASVFASTQDFEIGRFANDNTTILHGKARDVFICASALSDALLEELRLTSMP